MDEISQLTEKLCKRIKSRTVDLRYRDGKWGVMVPWGNTVILVRGSFNESIEAALRYCIDKWDSRDPNHPFLFWPGYVDGLGK